MNVIAFIKERHILPHVLISVAFLSFCFIGFSFDIGWVGGMLGAISGSAEDPICLIVSFIIGILFLDYKKFIIASICLSSFFSYAIGYQVNSWRSQMGLLSETFGSYFLRVLSVILLAHVFNLVRLLLSKGRKNASN